MVGRLTVEVLDGARERLHAIAAEYVRGLPGLRYCDIRVEVRQEKGAAAENGHEKASSEDATLAFGVRAISGDGATAPGYYGRILGDEDALRLEAVVRQGVRHAHQRALASARQKAEARSRYGALAESLTNTLLASVPVVRDTVPPVYAIDPRSVKLTDVTRMALDGCKAAAAVSSQIVYSVAYTRTSLIRELFLSSEGSDIEQSFAL
ncbi:MAG: TldD/PmbA family protein, partial [Rhodocyclaceae bacterium]|nr:TldD/PmbA family protein [Rhodocyclaceae bacterium]